MVKVLVTPRSFGAFSKEPVMLLEKHQIEVIEPQNKGILSREELMTLIHDVDGVIAGVDTFDADVLQEATNLHVISKYGVGVDNIDLNYCKEHNIEVCRAVGANSSAVADYAFTLLCAVARRTCEIDRGCRNNDWTKKNTVDIYGKKLGIIGLGNIGKGLAKRSNGFEMKVYAYDPYWDESFAKQNNIARADVETIVRECDFISLHMPLTPETHHIISREKIAMMKPNAIVINTARGGLIDEDALFEALSNHDIYGAGLDVFEHEPAQDTPFKELDNVILGSHCAASTEGAVDQMGLMSVNNLIEVLRERGIING